MRTSDVRTKHYQDPVSRKTRSRRWHRYIWWGIGGFFIIAGLISGILFSPIARITQVDIRGNQSVSSESVRAEVWKGFDRKFLGWKYTLANIVTTSPDALRDHIKNIFPQIGEVVVAREGLHTLAVTIEERQPAGIWCRQENCQFWSRDGARWGNTARSIGPLLLLVMDDRTEPLTDQRLFSGMLAAIDGIASLSLKARSITLPDAEPGGVRIATTAGYEVIFDGLGDTTDQLATLEVFLADRAKDKAFAPRYIDLRTPGRVYFK